VLCANAYSPTVKPVSSVRTEFETMTKATTHNVGEAPVAGRSDPRLPLATVGARDFPAAAAGSRLRFPECGHGSMSDSMAPPPSGRLGRFRIAHGEFAILYGDAYVKTRDG
jgi:hypothetical protein